MRQIALIEFQITGFIIALLLVAFTMVTMSTFLGETYTLGNLSANMTNNSLARYADRLNTSTLNFTDAIRTNSSINLQEETSLTFWDTVRAGWGAVKKSVGSISLFSDLTEEAVRDVPELDTLRTYLILIITVMIVLGVGIAVLVKMRI